MEQLEIQLKNLHTKLQQLLKQNQLLQKQCTSLQKENAVLNAELNEKNDMVIRMQRQIDVFKLNAHALDNKEKQDLKKRIDLYLAEIDKCLALINE